VTLRYTDQEIEALLAETKPLPLDYLAKLRMKPKRGHQEQDLDITGSDGSEFRVMLRQSLLYPRNFSVILAVRPVGTMNLFRLRRYNGDTHVHRNAIEGDIFRGFHIHQATARYQELGTDEDAFAQPTNRFDSVGSAVSCLITDCAFVTTGPDQLGFDFGPS
jgi:hypothetical protein